MNFKRIIFQCVKKDLKKLKNRLTSENLVANFKEKLDKIFKEYEQNNIIEKVPFDEVPKKSLVKFLISRIDQY